MSLSSFVVPPAPIPSVPIQGSPEQRFPVHRIYCVGRNYADHAREMGGDPDREAPFFFTKPADAVVPCPINEPAAISKDKCIIPYALATNDLQYEIELVIAIGKSGVNITEQDALNHIYGFAVGVDLTRRDLQTLAKKSGRPWDTSKGFDQSAPISSIVSKDKAPSFLSTSLHETSEVAPLSPEIWLSVQNGSEQKPERRQNGTLSQMTWRVSEIIVILSQQFYLQPGDLIFTGTPSGVGPLEKGSIVRGGVEGLAELEFTIV